MRVSKLIVSSLSLSLPKMNVHSRITTLHMRPFIHFNNKRKYVEFDIGLCVRPVDREDLQWSIVIKWVKIHEGS